MSKSRAPREQNAKPANQKNYSANETKAAPGQMPFVPPAPEDSHNSDGKIETTPEWWRSWSNWKRVLEVVGLIGALGYAVVTYFMWRDLRHNFEVDQRAWIRPLVRFPPTMINNFAANVTFQNVGKSVAVKPATVARLELVESHRQPSFELFTQAQGPFWRETLPMVFPGDVTQPANVPFNYTVDANTNAARPLTDSEVTDITAGKFYVAFHGVIAYMDQFGTHWTRFCSWRDYATAPAANSIFVASECVSYNSAGDGEPPKN